MGGGEGENSDVCDTLHARSGDTSIQGSVWPALPPATRGSQKESHESWGPLHTYSQLQVVSRPLTAGSSVCGWLQLRLQWMLGSREPLGRGRIVPYLGVGIKAANTYYVNA